MNVTEPLRRLARLIPDTVAIARADDRTIGYAELDRAIDAMACRALALGLRAGDIAGLAIAPPDEATALILALALARIGVASAAPSLPARHLRLCFEAIRPGQPPAAGRVGFDETWMQAAGEPVPVPIHRDGAAVLRVFASSGTTGRAKYIPISHDLMRVRAIGYELGLGGGRCTRMVTVGLGIAWSISTVLRTLWQGGTLVLFDARDPLAAIQRHQVSWVQASPAALRTLLDLLPAHGGPPSSLHTIEVGGSTLPEVLMREAVARLCPNLISLLGSAEAGGIAGAPVAVLERAAFGPRPGAVGLVFPGVQVQAVDHVGAVLPDGQEGVIRIRSEGVVPGYLGDDGAASGGLAGGWFYPGDIGTVWPDGMLCLTGRASELINRGGVKISPGLIEAGLLALPDVVDAAAFGVPDESGLEQIWAAIVARHPIDQAILAAYCDQAPAGRAPQVIFQLASLPRNENGKVRRDLLLEAARRLGPTA